MITYLDEEMQFSRALSIARQLLYLNMRSNFEARMLTGDETPIFFQGRPSFVEMEDCSDITDPDIREMLGYPRDGILRDSRGRRVQHVLKTPAPVAGVLAALAVGYPGEWTPSSRVENTLIQKTTGVTTPPPMTGPPVIPPRPVLPQLEVLPDVVVDDPDLDDLLGPAPVELSVDSSKDEPVDDVVEPVPVDTGPRIAVPTPAEWKPAGASRPISAKLAGLLRR